MPERIQSWVDGRSLPPSTGRWIPLLDPTTGDVASELCDAGSTDVDAAVGAAERAFRQWRNESASTRAALMNALADRLTEESECLAQLESKSTGRLLREMRAHVAMAISTLRFYAGLATVVEGSTHPLPRTSVFCYTRPEPLGVVGCITAWNSPLSQACAKVGPALATGNTCVVKPSEFGSPAVVRLAELATAAGLPPGVLNVVTGAGPETGAALVAHRLVAKVSFTGSDATGSKIGAVAGARLVPVTLELGGKSPNLFFGDIDPEVAVTGLLAGIFASAGQMCIAGSRALVHSSVCEELIERAVARTSKFVLGDPFAETTELGPIGNLPHYQHIDRMVGASIGAGAEVRIGGGPAEVPGLERGLFYSPTILTSLRNDSEVVRSEIFGPVLTLIPFEDEEEAIAIANDSPYGLAAGVWTSDLSRAHRVAARLEAGNVWVNTYRILGTNVPFGGTKRSGLGRENGLQAMYEHTQSKAVYVELEPNRDDPFRPTLGPSAR